MSNYQVADTVIRIKNAAAAKRRKVVLPYSRMNKQIANLLVKERFLSGMNAEDVEGKKAIVVSIAYEKRMPMFTDVSIISKPSLRVYTKAKNLTAKRKLGTGTTIVSTSKGVMTEKEAVEKSLGGEVLFRIW
jgi:small subunit ribosomal protein S8